jgi:hypothetical protein
MAENKTKPTEASVERYIASRANAQQSTDCRELMVLFKKVTRHSPRMWGPSIVGYGSYRYTYESGRTGEAPLAGFAIRGRDLVVYLLVEGEQQRSLLAKLGKHKMGKVCLYFKQLADLDRATLEKLVAGSVAEVKRRYGTRSHRGVAETRKKHHHKGHEETRRDESSFEFQVAGFRRKTSPQRSQRHTKGKKE